MRRLAGHTLVACALFLGAQAAAAPPAAKKTLRTEPPDDLCGPTVGHIVNPAWCALPREVHWFLIRRGDCIHFRNQPVPADDPDGDRQRALQAQTEASCRGLDAELARLRASHRDNAAVMAELSALEDRIE